MEGKLKSFPDKRRLKEHISTKPALQEILKGLLYKKEEERERGRNTGTQKMAMNKYLSTLNINGLNAPVRRLRVAE